MKNELKILVPALSIAMSGIAVAAESDPEWNTQAELGVVVTSGNTDTSTVNAKIDATYEEGKLRYNAHAEALKTESNDVTSGEKYLASGKVDYKISDKNFTFGLISYEKDRFSGFEYQASVVAGIGRRIYDENQMTLDVEAGPGVRFYKTTATNFSDEDPMLRVAAKYKWDISPTSVFTEDLSSEIGDELTVTKSVTALTANIDGSLAMKLSFTVKNTSDVPVGSKKTDTETGVTLVYSF